MGRIERVSPVRRPDGAAWIWLCALALALVLGLMIALGGLIVLNSFNALWPHRLERIELADGSALLGVPWASSAIPGGGIRRQYRVANRDFNGGNDFRWIPVADIRSVARPQDALLLKRRAGGDFYGIFLGLSGDDSGGGALEALARALSEHRAAWRRDGKPLADILDRLSAEWRSVRLAALAADYDAHHAPKAAARRRAAAEAERLGDRREEAKRASEDALARLNAVRARVDGTKARFQTGDGLIVEMPLAEILGVVQVNRLSLPGRALQFARNGWAALSEFPREANTDGGLLPALFGTALLVIIMAICAFPLGVAAGVYLREYARDNSFSRFARIAVNNLAGVPSIVYGIFGLGFFVYGLGGALDQALYPERVAAGIVTFKTGGILWSSLTLGLLTLPVVIVAAEEALAAVPGEMRQGSLALGATKFQTLRLVLMPMAAPGIMTGFILAMARAAGEVAPLMLTGAVKSAPLLAVDGGWPYLHLDRKFMHLGFHIYDMGFQSPNVEASKPMVYLTALALLVLVFALNAAAFKLRNVMRRRYAMKGL